MYQPFLGNELLMSVIQNFLKFPRHTDSVFFLQTFNAIHEMFVVSLCSLCHVYSDMTSQQVKGVNNSKSLSSSVAIYCIEFLILYTAYVM